MNILRTLSKHKSRIVAILLAIASIVWVTQHADQFFNSKKSSSSQDSTNQQLAIKEPVVLYGMTVTEFGVIEDHVKRNQRFFDLFDSVHVPSRIFQQLNTLSKKE